MRCYRLAVAHSILGARLVDDFYFINVASYKSHELSSLYTQFDTLW